MIRSSLKHQFRIEHFQQILSVCPEFYIHKWEVRKGEPELFIDMPSNVEDLLMEEHQEISEEPHVGYFCEANIELRKDMFSNELTAMAYDFFRNDYEDFDDAVSIKAWPKDFDYGACPEIKNSDLKPRPEMSSKQDTVSQHMRQHALNNDVDYS